MLPACSLRTQTVQSDLVSTTSPTPRPASPCPTANHNGGNLVWPVSSTARLSATTSPSTETVIFTSRLTGLPPPESPGQGSKVVTRFSKSVVSRSRASQNDFKATRHLSDNDRQRGVPLLPEPRVPKPSPLHPVSRVAYPPPNTSLFRRRVRVFRGISHLSSCRNARLRSASAHTGRRPR